MKILLLAPQPFYEERGTPIAVNLLLRVLSARGATVDVLTYPVGADREHPGVTIHRTRRVPGIKKIPPGLSVAKLVCDAGMFFKAWGMVRRQRYDVIHAVEESAFIARFLQRWYRVPFLYDMDSSLSRQIVDKHPWLGWLGRAMRWAEGRMIRDATAVIAVCPALVEEARTHRARRVYLLTDIALELASEPTAEEQALFPPAAAGCRFVYVGNLESYQGIDLLVAAFHKLVADPASPPAHLIVAGGVPGDIARYEALARQLGVADRVRFIGPQPVARLGAMLALADVLVSPRTQGNNTPMKIYSYMASGKPVLATALPTHTQVLSDETACLAAPEPDAFAAGMRRLAASPEWRAQLGAAAQARAAAAHSWEAFQRTVNQIYDDFAARQTP